MERKFIKSLKKQRWEDPSHQIVGEAITMRGFVEWHIATMRSNVHEVCKRSPREMKDEELRNGYRYVYDMNLLLALKKSMSWTSNPCLEIAVYKGNKWLQNVEEVMHWNKSRGILCVEISHGEECLSWGSNATANVTLCWEKIAQGIEKAKQAETNSWVRHHQRQKLNKACATTRLGILWRRYKTCA